MFKIIMLLQSRQKEKIQKNAPRENMFCYGLEIVTVPVFCRMVKATSVYAAFSPNVSNNEYELTSTNEICHMFHFNLMLFFP